MKVEVLNYNVHVHTLCIYEIVDKHIHIFFLPFFIIKNRKLSSYFHIIYWSMLFKTDFIKVRRDVVIVW